ncbi:MAG: MATE family efflux transporter, partial [Clostridia bacterium]|nr:MATE family efflux transporter [Clostridia bacterium]
MRLALPSIMGQVILVIYNMADTFFIGMTGSDAMLTAVTVCMPAFMFLSAISNLFGVGGASVISRALGKGKESRARFASAYSFWACMAVTLVYCIGVFVFREPFVDLLGGTHTDVHKFSVDYLVIAVVAGGLVTALNTLFSHLLRAEGKSISASIGIIAGGFLNIILDPIFMFVILPRGQEVRAAAISTALSNAIALLYYV